MLLSKPEWHSTCATTQPPPCLGRDVVPIAPWPWRERTKSARSRRSNDHQLRLPAQPGVPDHLLRTAPDTLPPSFFSPRGAWIKVARETSTCACIHPREHFHTVETFSTWQRSTAHDRLRSGFLRESANRSWTSMNPRLLGKLPACPRLLAAIEFCSTQGADSRCPHAGDGETIDGSGEDYFPRQNPATDSGTYR